jgi:long-chain acyl-CoA synthetase
MKHHVFLGKNIPQVFFELVDYFAQKPAQYFPNAQGIFESRSFFELGQEVQNYAAGLSYLGVQRGQHVGLISENRPEWLVANLGILSLGASDVPRGTDTMPQELSYILEFTGVSHCIVESEKQLEKISYLLATLPLLKHLLVLDPKANLEAVSLMPGISVWSYADVINKGIAARSTNPDIISTEISKTDSNDLASIIFTSGTTGEPKGVMLSHQNFLHQIRGVEKKLTHGPGDIWLCILPVWHSFERIMQLVIVLYGSAIAYSKPLAKYLLPNLVGIRPSWMAGVPRIWQALRQDIDSKINSHGGIQKILYNSFLTIARWHYRLSIRIRALTPQYRLSSRLLTRLIASLPWLILLPLRGLGELLVFQKIRAGLGGRLRSGISGGASLPLAVEEFFGAIGICLLDGYGLTETGPIIAVRTRWRAVSGTVGSPLPGTEVQIRNPQGQILGPGQSGLLFVRGPQVMKGYFKKPLKTREIITNDGWLDTGDLAILSRHQEIRLVGRAKDTIVLSSGENIEPAPIELGLEASSFISQSIVLGQDKKFLGVLIVPAQERTINWAKEHNIQNQEWTEILKHKAIQNLFREEINRLICLETGFRHFEHINCFRLLPKVFEVGKELSAKNDLKRHYIVDVYAREIGQLFGEKHE